VQEKPSRYATFLALLRNLRPAIKSAKRLEQWWESLLRPVLDALGEEKGLAAESRAILLDVLVYDADDPDSDIAEISSNFAQKLLLVWLEHVEKASVSADPSASFIEKQIKDVLLVFGRKRPRDFLSTIDAEFVRTRYRTHTLSILCEFVRYQPPHLHQLLQTPLFDNLIRCLTIDTSTTVVSLAMTALIMFLPHIPSAMAAHLPSLFIIYSRILFWEKERVLSPVINGGKEMIEDAEITPVGSPEHTKTEHKWEKLSFSFESADSTVPELLHYFTFLYGLYPLNFMSYIRKPQRYLRHANFAGADDVEIEPAEIRQRSEKFRQLHLLHPNFFTMTIESELTDPNRFMKSEAADVVADCMALCGPLYPGISNLPRPPPARPLDSPEPLEDDDIPEQPLLDRDDDASRTLASPTSSRHDSWRINQSTSVASPDSSRAPSRLLRKASQTSQSVVSMIGSPLLRPRDVRVEDSPTLPPQVAMTSDQTPLQDMLISQKSLKGPLHQSLPDESVQSLILSPDNVEMQGGSDTFLQSLAQHSIPQSPSMTDSLSDPKKNIANLRREILLLKNDLNFERYLKQQHLSHIGQLRRKHVKEATVEAETQNLINANKSLKTKLEEARRSELQIKKESERSRSHSKKWEADLASKLRTIREEQKKWLAEGEELRRDLATSRENCSKLRQLVVDSEARELLSKQKMASIELDLEELETLRAEVTKLNAAVHAYEGQEHERAAAHETAASAQAHVETLKLQLRSRDEELRRVKEAYDQEVTEMRAKLESSDGNHNQKAQVVQTMIEGALSATRNRLIELQKAHNLLLHRYTTLESSYFDLKESQDFDEPLLASRARMEDERMYRSSSPMVEYRNRQLGTPDQDPQHRSSNEVISPVGSINSGYLTRPRLNLPARAETTPLPAGAHAPIDHRPISNERSSQGSSSGTQGYHNSAGSEAAGPVGGLVAGGLLGPYYIESESKPKSKPRGETRLYGRGKHRNQMIVCI
jgi:solute carrier family 25 protein 16